MAGLDRLDKMELVLLALEDEGGVFVREAGFVLADLSFITGIPYATLSAVVLEMEREGYVTVDRAVHREHRQANRLMSIRVVP